VGVLLATATPSRGAVNYAVRSLSTSVTSETSAARELDLVYGQRRRQQRGRAPGNGDGTFPGSRTTDGQLSACGDSGTSTATGS